MFLLNVTEMRDRILEELDRHLQEPHCNHSIDDLLKGLEI